MDHGDNSSICLSSNRSTLGIVWTGELQLGLGLTISLLHGRPCGIDPVEEGADPGVDPRKAVAAVPGPIAHNS